jgi:DNA-binding MarR family transcriptional regulator
MAEHDHRSLAAADEAQFVSQIVHARRKRTQLFGATLFADPAWDMMLELYLATLEGRRLATSEVGNRANVPMTTSLRWIDSLETYGWVRRVPDARDHRRHFIELSGRGLETMSVWLREWMLDLSKSPRDARVSDLLNRIGRDTL